MTVAQTDTLIIGGGLSGLALAQMLHDAGQSFAVLEARARLGGRILVHETGSAAFDLGPAWFWPGQQRMAALVQRHGLTVFEQASQGDFRYETAQGQIQQGRAGAAMQGSYRLAGGMTALTAALAAGLPDQQIHTRTQVTALVRDGSTLRATTADGRHFSAGRAVLALPPRLAAQIRFSPALPDSALSALKSVPTWMAGQAKALALYDEPFWRSAGLSGDAMSQRGPLVEIHDASPVAGGPYALFGFVGTPPVHRRNSDALRGAIADQLLRLFGPDAPDPRAVILKDWAADAATATPADAEPLTAHPSYGMPSALRGLWEGRLLMGGSEVADTFGGYLEGALEAAEANFALLSPARRRA